MKNIKSLILLLLLLSSISKAQAQYMTIPDNNFVTWLQNEYPNCMNGNQMDTTCTAITSELLIVFSSGLQLSITNLEGIQYFNNLGILDCSDLGLVNLPYLPNSIFDLNISNNNITYLLNLPTSLEKLSFSRTPIGSLPNLPSGLKTLWAQHLTNFTPPDSLPVSIEIYAVEYSKQTLLPILPNTLEALFIRDNNFTNLPVLPTKLKRLDCQRNNLTKLPIMPNQLNALNCGSNNISRLPNLPKSLTSLDASHTLITSLPVLPDTMNAIIVESSNLYHINNFPKYMNGDNWIDVSGNMLTHLPTIPDNIRVFHAKDNQILCLPLIPSVVSILHLERNLFDCLPNRVSIMSSFPYLDTLPLCSPGYICPSAIKFFGSVKNDVNSNCSLDTTDLPIKNITVNLLDKAGNLVAKNISSFLGEYLFNTGYQSSFQVQIDTANNPVSVYCSSPGIDSTLNAIPQITGVIDDINFLVKCASGYDVGVQSIVETGYVFPGQPHVLNVDVGDMSSWYSKNLNCASGVSGTVTINITGDVSYLGPTAGALSPIVNGLSFTYQIADFGNVDMFNDFKLNLMTDTTVVVGDAICVNVVVDPLVGDNKAVNNVYNYCYYAVNSHDPNDKTVYPVEVNPDFDGWLTYTIRFQNTGTAPAFNINLGDTIANDLDLETFKAIGASHRFSYSLIKNKLNIYFRNIMLPDSTTNEAESKGYFQYRVKPKSSLPLGTKINNTAYIFFDFNDPIVTNTCVTEYVEKKYHLKIDEFNWDSSVSVYPNPNNGDFIISIGEEINDVSFSLHDLLGRSIPFQLERTGMSYRLKMTHSMNGLVVLTVDSPKGRFQTKLIID